MLWKGVVTFGLITLFPLKDYRNALVCYPLVSFARAASDCRYTGGIRAPPTCTLTTKVVPEQRRCVRYGRRLEICGYTFAVCSSITCARVLIGEGGRGERRRVCARRSISHVGDVDYGRPTHYITYLYLFPL